MYLNWILKQIELFPAMWIVLWTALVKDWWPPWMNQWDFSWWLACGRRRKVEYARSFIHFRTLEPKEVAALFEGSTTIKFSVSPVPGLEVEGQLDLPFHLRHFWGWALGVDCPNSNPSSPAQNGVRRLDEIIHLKHLIWVLPNSKYSVNVSCYY